MEGGLQAEAEAKGEQTEDLPTVYSAQVKYWGCGVGAGMRLKRSADHGNQARRLP